MTHNYDDPRVRRRMEKAFAFCIAWLGAKGRPLGRVQIDSAFGQQHNPVSKWIREQLLICTDHRWNKDTGKTKQWAYNTGGILEFADILGYPAFEYNANSPIGYNKQLELFYRSYAIEYLNDRFKDQLNTGKFVYRDSSSRLWSPLQNLRREVRTELFQMNGYNYQLDIESCAPTLLYQLWQRNNRFRGDLVEMPRIRELIADRTGVRARVSAETGIGIDEVKTAITSLFNGARLVSNGYCALFRELDQDPEMVQLLKQNEWIAGLIADVKNLWTGISHGMPEVREWNNSVKWQIYFEMERLVIDQMDKYATEYGARTFRIHDCLVSDKPLDVNEMIDSVRLNTDLSIKLELKEYSLATQV